MKEIYMSPELTVIDLESEIITASYGIFDEDPDRNGGEDNGFII